MKSTITILKGRNSLTKHYKIGQDGKPQKGEVKPSYLFDSQTVEVTSLDDLYKVVKETSTDPFKTFIRGRSEYPRDFDIRRLKNNEFKKGKFNEVPTQWVCIDFDEAITPAADRLSGEAIEWLIKNKLPESFHDVSYVYQWSNSAGLEYNRQPIKNGTNVHLFFWLDKGLKDFQFDLWFKNRDVDKATFRTTQPIFVGTKVEKDERIIDRLKDDQKIGLVEKLQQEVATPTEEWFSCMAKSQSADKIPLTVDSETSDKILLKLNEVGCIHRRQADSLGLWHKQEKTKGGWYVFTANPSIIHHPAKKSMHVTKWLRDFWGVEFAVEDPKTDAITQFIENKKDKAKPAPSTPDEEEQDLLVFDDNGEPISEPYSRAKRADLIWNKCQDLGPVTLLYAAEGFGKSHLAVRWAKEKDFKVLFCCESNLQAEKQAATFKEKLGDDAVQIITSRQYNLKKQYQIEPVTYHQKSPWEPGGTNEQVTIDLIAQSLSISIKQAAELWERLDAAEPDFDTFKVVVTTHARLKAWGKVQQSRAWKAMKKASFAHPLFTDEDLIIPKDTIVVIDDPGWKDFTRLHPVKKKKDKRGNASYDFEDIDVINKDGREYYARPDELIFGYGMHGVKLVFTTTELITSELIKKEFTSQKNPFVRWLSEIDREKGVDQPNLLPPNKLDAGHVSMFATSMVASKMDGLLPPIMERLKREGYEFEYIADGQGNKFNLVNTKGMNTFTDKDLIVEISHPVESLVNWLMDELGWSGSHKRAIRIAIMTDLMNQAIGRVAGYRASDKEYAKEHFKKVIVLVHPQFLDALFKTSRCWIREKANWSNEKKSMIRDGEALADGLRWYVQNHYRYMTNGREFEYDCLSALTATDDWRVLPRKKRMVKAIKTVMEELPHDRLSAVLALLTGEESEEEDFEGEDLDDLTVFAVENE